MNPRNFDWGPVLGKGIGPLWIFYHLLDDLFDDHTWLPIGAEFSLLGTLLLLSSLLPVTTILPLSPIYHPNFAARQFGLGQHIPLPHESMESSLHRRKLLLMDLRTVLKDLDEKFLALFWGTYQKNVGETSVYMYWCPLIKEFIFLDSAVDYIIRYMGAVGGLPHHGTWLPVLIHHSSRLLNLPPARRKIRSFRILPPTMFRSSTEINGYLCTYLM